MTTMLTRAVDPAAEIFSGGATVIVDDDGAVLSFPAAAATAVELHHAIRLSSGLIHAAMPSFLLDRLRVPDQPVLASERSDATFTVAVDAASGIGTGISAHDRARTLQVLADQATVADDLVRPGHVLPVRCDDGGFRARRRCWELAVDLVVAEGFPPVAVVARLVDDIGDVLDADAALAFAVDHGLQVHT
ncbi:MULTISPECIES: 3,4-dihydroxy-2-butanone-4-phosphate synthase [unclassified Gordonia (in: high G+C Gram-positive bacteria)]|uniref:3,4-dihydroxy-2-butanone-4-phosphate synthase n=1 Tax=unclassified Gordonia (in: high G+C Gram-positive bacteria) TaxID=2657482 RepID=UPI0007E9B788|nr:MULTISPECIES: 3,4-dihydroxy-2-butanone-4-phosphate synthase [unclassified Gordonia (in: high G+C Gram-positive bacteria)]OBC06554.1 3,4-dihydroxy-2-butanone 4-phosphate synthase [Gordonia sp. 852002-50395_SCH5434458]OBC11683.1 3,4-dihydroxy-2-butanone 4-phosphate synthase [Gordonia sp. 852002-50816_SCH5313054-a]OBC16736.1 3,4-dihydroxy-2-butanone 4-phosphate synthase [Gordonia sp. 852002-50816_SCH5313054-c]